LNFDLRPRGRGNQVSITACGCHEQAGRGTGAANVLLVAAALRIGAGLVTGCPPAAQNGSGDANQPRYCCPGAPAPRKLGELASDKRIGAICIGPGLGLKRAQAATGQSGAWIARKPCVLDATSLDP